MPKQRTHGVGYLRPVASSLEAVWHHEQDVDGNHVVRIAA
jgi:hypothetical protein